MCNSVRALRILISASFAMVIDTEEYVMLALGDSHSGPASGLTIAVSREEATTTRIAMHASGIMG